MTFYMYRAQGAATYPLRNVDMADLPGVLWYLHDEVVTTCPRKNGITRILRRKLTVMNTQELYDDRRTQFGPFVAFDKGQCTVPGCDAIWQQYGFVVGCQVLDVSQANYNSPQLPHSNCAMSQDWGCDGAVWYSVPGHSCAEVTGAKHCTYHMEDAGEVDLDNVTGIGLAYAAFCDAGGLEYDKALDRGHNFHWWDLRHVRERCDARIQAVKNAFARKYPGLPADLERPPCG